MIFFQYLHFFVLKYMLRSITVLALVFVTSSALGQVGSDTALPEDPSREGDSGMYENRLMVDLVRPLNSNIAVSYGRKFSNLGLRLNFSYVPKGGSSDLGWDDPAIYPFLLHPSRNLFKWTSSVQFNYYFMDMDSDAVGVYMSFLAGGFEHKSIWVVADPCLGDCGFSGDVYKEKWTYFYMLGLGAGVEVRISDRFFLNSDLELGFYNPLEKKGIELAYGVEAWPIVFFQSIDIGYRF